MFYSFSSVSLCWWTGYHTHDPRITSITCKWGLSSCNVTDTRRNEWQPYKWMSSQNQHKWVQYLPFYVARDSKVLRKADIKLEHIFSACNKTKHFLCYIHKKILDQYVNNFYHWMMKLFSYSHLLQLSFLQCICITFARDSKDNNRSLQTVEKGKHQCQQG